MNNQITSTSLGTVQYDSAGDVTQDNQNQYLYNGDGQLCAVKSLMFGTMVGYIYGADGTRLSTGTISSWGSCDPSVNGYTATKDSIAGPSGGQLTEAGVDANGNVVWAHTNVWVGGQLLATYDPSGIHFYLSDWTGSRRVQTDYEGVVEQTCTSLPYGDGETCSATPDEELYAGLERDSAAGLDNAMYRSYASAFGRWTTPDPYGGSYNWSDPQSLNRYAYVGGSPFGGVDPSGLDVDATAWLYYGVGSDAELYGSALDSWINSLTPYVPFLNAADLAYNVFGLFDDLGNAFGWWGGGSPFHGNVNASQSGKNVPVTASVNAPGPPSGTGNSILNTWLKITSPIDRAATWADNHPLVVFPAAIIAAIEGDEGPIEEDEAVIEEALTNGFGSGAFGTAMHAQFPDVLLEQTGTVAQDWQFAAPNAPGVDATYFGTQNLGFNAAELKPVGFDMNRVGNQIGSFKVQPGTTSVWWYNSNGIIGNTGFTF